MKERLVVAEEQHIADLATVHESGANLQLLTEEFEALVAREKQVALKNARAETVVKQLNEKLSTLKSAASTEHEQVVCGC